MNGKQPVNSGFTGAARIAPVAHDAQSKDGCENLRRSGPTKIPFCPSNVKVLRDFLSTRHRHCGQIARHCQSEPTDERHPHAARGPAHGAHARPAARVGESYGVATPIRSHGGQRLYSNSDVERLSVGTWLVHMELHERRSSVSSLPAALSAETPHRVLRVRPCERVNLKRDALCPWLPEFSWDRVTRRLLVQYL